MNKLIFIIFFLFQGQYCYSAEIDQIKELEEKNQLLRKEVIKLRQEMAKIQLLSKEENLSYQKREWENYFAIQESNLEMLKWQREASKILLYLVIVIVISGLIFSGYQIWKATNIRDLGETGVEIESQRIKIKTSIVGILILAISILFFYFFIKEVYTIKLIDINNLNNENSIALNKN